MFTHEHSINIQNSEINKSDSVIHCGVPIYFALL